MNEPLLKRAFWAGYAALFHAYDLDYTFIGCIKYHKHKQYTTSGWKVFTPRHRPEDTSAGNLTFALKYEGIELGLLKKLFEKVPTEEIIRLITREPTGQYSRKTGFLYEWLMGVQLDISDLTTGSYIGLVDTSIQYGATETVKNSKRHRVRNNLPGTKDFCPMIRKTRVLEEYISMNLSGQIKDVIGRIHPDIMARTAA